MRTAHDRPEGRPEVGMKTAPAPAGAPPWPCLSVHGDAVWLAVSVQPNARRTAADGLHDGALRILLGAPPVDGKANQWLIEWLAGSHRRLRLGPCANALRVSRALVQR